MLAVTLGTAQTVGVSLRASPIGIAVTTDADLLERLIKLIQIDHLRPMGMMTLFTITDGKMRVVFRGMTAFAVSDLKGSPTLLRVRLMTITAFHRYGMRATALFKLSMDFFVAAVTTTLDQPGHIRSQQISIRPRQQEYRQDNRT